MDFDDGAEMEEDEVSIKLSQGFSISGATTTLASMESLSLPIVQEVVVFADMQCKNCQKRVSDIITKMNETESLEVSVLEKKVTLTFRLPTVGEVMRRRQLAPVTRTSLPKVALIKRLFRPFHVLH